jgi:sugar phosphate isomerase/epimerase
VEAHVTTGGSVDEVAGAIADAGLRCSDVLVLVAGIDRDLSGTAQTLGSLAERLGAEACITAVGAPVPWPELVAALGDCADIVTGHGCRLAIEFTPYSALATLPAAKELCAAICWDRAGVVLDSLHFFRSGAPWEELADLTPDQVALVQWDDAPAAPPESLVDESRNQRVPPGQGGLALRELGRAIRALGYDGLVSAEILSERFRRDDPATVTRAIYAAMTSADAGWVTASAG